MNETGWTDIAKVGTWTTSSGETFMLDESKLDKIINQFQQGERRVPLVFGHPKDNQPAYGWLFELRRSGSTLQAKFKQIHKDVLKLVENGNFKNVSVSLTPDMNLRHIGLLGAVQPAIKGLREVAFSCEDGITILDFSAENELLTSYPATEYAAGCKTLDAQRAELEAGWNKLKAERHNFASEKAVFHSEMNNRRVEEREQRFEALVKSCRCLPAEKEQILSLASCLAEVGTNLQFSESEEALPAEEVFWHFMEGRPQHSLLTEFTAPDKKQEEGGGNPANLI